MIGSSLPMATACSKSSVSTTKNPAITSLLSMNGPSVTSPSLWMVRVVALGARPCSLTTRAPMASIFGPTARFASITSGGMSATPPGVSFS
jgi:hypothetical protein